MKNLFQEFLPPNRRGFNQLRHRSISNRLPTVVTPIPIRDAFARYLDDMRATACWAPVTIRAAAILYDRFVRSVGPDAITTDQLTPEMFKAMVGPNLSPASRKSYSIRLITAVNWMVRRGYVAYEVAELCIAALHTPRPEPRRHTTLSRDIVKRVLEYIPRRFHENPALILRNTVLVRLLYDMCLRVSEVAALRVCDVDLDRRELHTRRLGPSARVSIPLELIDLLSAWLTARASFPNAKDGPDEPLLPSRLGTTLRCDQVYVIINGLFEDCGTKDGPYALRRAGAVHKFEDGWNTRRLRDLLGVSSLITLDRMLAAA